MGYIGIILCFIPLIVCFLILTLAFKLKVTHQLLAMLFGLIAVLPISVIQYLIPNFNFLNLNLVFYSFLKSLLIYGMIEEIFKTILLLPVPHKDYSQRDYLLLSFLMGLTLGCFESVVYYFDHLQIASYKGADLLYAQIFLRIFTSDIIRMTCTGLCGLFIYSCRAKPRKISVFIVAILIHGVYDFFAGFHNNLKYFSIAVVLLAIIECRVKYKNIENLCENRLTIFY